MSGRLVTTAELVDLLGAEPDEPAEPEYPEYAPATAADITLAAARTGWLQRRPVALPGGCRQYENGYRT